MISIEPNINVGNILVTGALALVGVGLRTIYKLAIRTIDRYDQMATDLDEHAGVLNVHTSLLVKGGLSDGIGIPRVERRRHWRGYNDTTPLGGIDG